MPSFEDSVENLVSLAIPKWGNDIDDEGILAGIQCELFICVLMMLFVGLPQ